MISKLVQTEFMKLRRKGIWFLTFLGPFGVVALQMVNYGLRKDWFISQGTYEWFYYVRNVSAFTPFALILGIVILTSFMASIESETKAWKQVMALPVTKWSVYIAKYTTLVALLMIACLLLVIFTLCFGLYLGFDGNVPYLDIIKYSYYPFIAALPVLGLQLWLATVSQNQGLPITLGVLGVILSYMAYFLPDWMIWKWPSLDNAWDEPLVNVGLGLAVGLGIYLIGMIDFIRRDVK
ncbi:ABC transporter permease [Ornithinibacillus californiensis]|uniref:ABC transporter permease n=1 Tax=Ornithinibacillus californiensis TaxID=161536 RepID=UPI00064E0120|nr:ABC transporter permease [Ornithinibacillus californiensis]